MRWVVSVGAMMTLLSTWAVSQDTQPTIYEVKYKYDKALRQIDGVLDVTVGGIDGEMRIIVRVRDEAAKHAAMLLTGGKLDAHRLHFILSADPRPTVAEEAKPQGESKSCPCECHSGPGKTVAAPREPEPVDPYEQCDWVREMMKLPARKGVKDRCLQMVSWTNDPQRIKYAIREGFPHFPSQEMPGLRGSDKGGADCPQHGVHPQGEIICYTWVKHRFECPIGNRKEKVRRAADGLTPGK